MRRRDLSLQLYLDSEEFDIEEDEEEEGDNVLQDLKCDPGADQIIQKLKHNVSKPYASYNHIGVQHRYEGRLTQKISRRCLYEYKVPR